MPSLHLQMEGAREGVGATAPAEGAQVAQRLLVRDTCRQLSPPTNRHLANALEQLGCFQAHVCMLSSSCQYSTPHMMAGAVAHSWSSTHTQQAVLARMS